MALNFGFDVFVGLINQVDFRIQCVDIVVQAVVLLFSLDESGHDLVVTADSSFGLDCLEGVFDDSDVSSVKVHKGFLL